jgi:hypothetical protein
MQNTFWGSGAKEKFIQGVEDIAIVRIRVKGTVLVKVKEPRNRPGVIQRVPGGLGSQIS